MKEEVEVLLLLEEEETCLAEASLPWVVVVAVLTEEVLPHSGVVDRKQW
jgi:hypothetical protein